MKTFGRILFFSAVLALSHLRAEPSLAQTSYIDALNKKIIELYTAGKYPEAIEIAKHVLAMREKELGPDHTEIVLSLSRLADLYVVAGRYAEAEPLYKRSLTILQKNYGSDNPDVERVRQKLSLLESARQQTRVVRPPEPGLATNQIDPSKPPPPSAPPAPQIAAAPVNSARPSPLPSAANPPPPPAGAVPATAEVSVLSATKPAAAPAATPPSQTLPDFPWPIPAASASYVLPRNLLSTRTTVGQVVGAIVSALERTGYVERSFFRTKANGVALVTRLERINDDGTARSEAERWPAGLKGYQSGLDLGQFFKGLFYVERGRYRVIVFILQDLPFVPSPNQVTGQEAREWLRTGANVLPHDVENRPYGGDANCSVLVYEFASDGTAVRMVESSMTGKQHLEKAGVLAYLEKTN